MKDNTKKSKDIEAAKKKPSALKKWWDNYIKRLNKVTNGKPQCCK